MRVCVMIMVVAVPAAAFADPVHDVELGYDAGVTSTLGGGARAVASLGGHATDTITLGGYHVDLAASAELDGTEGSAAGFGASTNARVAITPFRAGAVCPFCFELDHAGELNAVPRLSDRLDVRRAPFTWEELGGAIALNRVAEEVRGHRFGIDLISFRHRETWTWQDERARVDSTNTVEIAAWEGTEPVPGRLAVLSIQNQASHLVDEPQTESTVLWLARFDQAAPSGVTYTTGWGILVYPPGAPVHHVLAFGMGAGDEDHGVGLQAEKNEPYLTLDGDLDLRDSGSVDAWFRAAGTRWSGRAYAARTRPFWAGGRGVWTGGVELGARRDVGIFDVGVEAEAGRSYYAALDGADPTPAFGATGALTIKRSAAHRWFY
jgi:hypothetical protein